MDQIYEKTFDTATIRKINTPQHRGLLRRFAMQGLIYLLVVAAAYVFFLFSHRHVLQAVQVDGTSMAPTLRDGNCYLLNRLVYSLRDPKLMEVVALRDPEDRGLAVKRVVAQPGDRVYLSDGQLFVNGKPLVESYLDRGTKTYADPRYAAQLWICGVNQYFVLGDNRNSSVDSRVYGAVPRQNIIGMVMQIDFSRWF